MKESVCKMKDLTINLDNLSDDFSKTLFIFMSNMYDEDLCMYPYDKDVINFINRSFNTSDASLLINLINSDPKNIQKIKINNKQDCRLYNSGIYNLVTLLIFMELIDNNLTKLDEKETNQKLFEAFYSISQLTISLNLGLSNFAMNFNDFAMDEFRYDKHYMPEPDLIAYTNDCKNFWCNEIVREKYLMEDKELLNI